MDCKKLNFDAPLLSVRINRKTTETPRPHRQLSVPSHKTDWDLSEVTTTKPVAIPFVWEQAPGRSKSESKMWSAAHEEPSITPRFPPGRVFNKRVSGEQFMDQTVISPQVEASPLNENVKVVNKSDASASENEDDAFLDAFDVMSAAESFSWTCSVSGLSGYDGHGGKLSKTFVADAQTRDLIMTRFLPAARAMIIQTPQYVPKKQPAEIEPPRYVRMVFSGELRPILERYGSNTASYHSQYKGNITNDDDVDDECFDRGRKSGKGCGLLPRLSVKHSPSRAQSPISYAPEVRRMPRTAYSGPLPQIHQKKHDRDAIYWNHVQSVNQLRESDENKPTNLLNNQYHYSSDSGVGEHSSPPRRTRSGVISPYRNEKPRSPFHDGAKFLGIPKIIKNFEADKISSISKGSDKFSDDLYQRAMDSLSGVVEKTLYIDYVFNAEMPASDLVSSKEANVLDKLYKDTSVESRAKEELSNNDKTEGWKKDENLGNLEMKGENSEKVNDKVDLSCVELMQSPQPPPLPKSPSEPWLWRTLPSISLRNPFSHKKQGQKKTSAAAGAKWENIVKSSHVRHDRTRFSEELISHVSHHSGA